MQASLIRAFILAAVPIFIGMLLSGCGGGGGGGTTPAPTPAPTTTTVTTLPPARCICIFDVDRTLTGKQDSAKKCPDNAVQEGVTDTAYGGGTLILSEAGQHLEKTFCAKCLHGIVSAGEVSGHGSKERDVIFAKVGPENMTLTPNWQDSFPHAEPFESSLVLGWPDGQKQTAVKDIIDWFMKVKGVYIPNEMVHFFDDRDINVAPFEGTGYNAQEISCSTRDATDNNAIGLCGATLAEIVPTKGVNTCASKKKVYV